MKGWLKRNWLNVISAILTIPIACFWLISLFYIAPKRAAERRGDIGIIEPFDPSVPRTEFNRMPFRHPKSHLPHEQVQIIYNHPTVLAFERSSKIIAIVATNDALEALAMVSQGTGSPAKGKGNFASRVRGILSGPDADVEIQPVGPPVRAIDASANTTWMWYVRPKTLHDFDLTLTFSNVFNGEGNELDAKAFTSTFKVSASPVQYARYYATAINPFYAAIVGLITTVGGLLAWRERRKEKIAKVVLKPLFPRRHDRR